MPFRMSLSQSDSLMDISRGGLRLRTTQMLPDGAIIKFFVPLDQRPDRSENQRPGEKGITLHSVTVPNLRMVHDLALEHRLETTGIMDNEFGERSFVISGPDGSAWQVIERAGSKNPPATEFALVTVNN